MANSNPNHSTRFKPGASANPGGKPKPKPQPPDPAPDPSPDATPDPRGILERTVAKLTAIMDDPDAEVGYQLAAIRVLVSGDLASTVRYLERDRTEDATRRDRLERGVGLVREHHPEVGADVAERYVRECLDRMEPTNLTEILKDRLGFWKSEPLTDETLGQIWVELGLPGNPGPSEDGREGRSDPASGVPPEDNSSSDLIPPPSDLPPPPSPPPPTPAPPSTPAPIRDEPTPAPDRPFLDFGGLCFTPDLGD